MKFRKINHWLHLYLGLSAGIIVFIIAITGCIYVFQKDIYEAINAKAIFIQAPPNTPQLPLTTLQNIAEKSIGGKKISYITTYAAPNRSWEFLSYKTANPQAFFYFDTIETYLNVLINPYTGKVMLVKDYKYDFFNIVKYLHWNLLINHPLGQQIVGGATLIFIFLLISGMIMWWPKSLKKVALKHSFSIKWRARFKRLNYDLHNVLGFYTMIIALLLALTGIIWTYKWFETNVYTLAAGNTPHVNKLYTSDPETSSRVINPLEQIFATANNILTTKARITISLPGSTQAVIYVSAYPTDSAYYSSDNLQFDQYSAKLLFSQTNATKNNGDKLLAMNYDLHTGSILGMPSKIIAFLASLVAASLPITGFIFWWGRRRKL